MLTLLVVLSVAVMVGIPEGRATSAASAEEMRPVRRLAVIGPSEQRVAVLTDDRCVVRDSATGDLSPLWLKEGDERAMFVAGSPVDERVAIGLAEGIVRVTDTATGAGIWSRRFSMGRPSEAVFSPDGATIALGTETGTILVLDAATGETRVAIATTADPRAICFTPDGLHIIAPATADAIGVWEAETGTAVRRLEGAARMVISLAVSPDGGMVAGASCEGAALVWDLPTGRNIVRFSHSSAPIMAVAFSPDGRNLVMTASDERLLCFVPGTESPQRVLNGHGKPVRDLVFARGKLVSGGFDGRVIEWVVETGMGKAWAEL